MMVKRAKIAKVAQKTVAAKQIKFAKTKNAKRILAETKNATKKLEKIV